MAAPALELLFTLTADTNLTGMIANGPMGTRVIVDASSGTFDGPRLRGTVSGPGGDWVTVRADGTMQLDVRILLKTDDGADIYCEYKGIGLDGATHITTAPMFQTAHENYTWLNNVVAVARGTSGGGKVTYEVYEVKWSAFTDAERAYLVSQRVARIGTASTSGRPDVAAVRYQLRGDVIDIGGRVNPATYKWHNVVNNGRASVTIDDIASEDPWAVRGIKIYGRAEAIEREGTTGRILVHPEIVWSWNINDGAETYFADMIEKRIVEP